LLFTDGVIEVEDLRGNELGIDGLKDLLAQWPSGMPPDFAELEDQLLAHSGCIHFPDDLTLIALHRPEDIRIVL
jgi:serine phosphatase RsbU (regulator of sigma subunit)